MSIYKFKELLEASKDLVSKYFKDYKALKLEDFILGNTDNFLAPIYNHSTNIKYFIYNDILYIAYLDHAFIKAKELLSKNFVVDIFKNSEFRRTDIYECSLPKEIKAKYSVSDSNFLLRTVGKSKTLVISGDFKVFKALAEELSMV